MSSSEFIGKEIKKIRGVQEMENMLTKLFYARQLVYDQILQHCIVINIVNLWDPIE
jgi:hypothetical protein